jgi:hypothetical protein
MDQDTTNSQNGGPSEDRGIKKGELLWTPALKKDGDIRLWLFMFEAGAVMYLSKEVYPKTEERRYAWLNALIRAASLGGNEEMIRLLQLYDANGVRCEDLLKKIEAKFLPAQEIERKKVSTAFMHYQRENKTLTEAVKELKVLVMECAKLGYTPDDHTLQTKYESLLQNREVNFYRLYLKHDDYKDHEGAEKAIRVIEDIGRDDEAGLPGQDSTPPFSGGAWDKKKGPRRQGYTKNTPKDKPSGQQRQEDGKKCKYCGDHCPGMKGEGKEKCFAWGKKCTKCNKQNHLASMCKAQKGSKGAKNSQSFQ